MAILITYRQGIDYHQLQKSDKPKVEFEQTNTINGWFNRWVETKSDNNESTQRGYTIPYTTWIKPKLGNRSIVTLSDENEIE